MNIWECIDRNPFTCFSICVVIAIFINGIVVSLINGVVVNLLRIRALKAIDKKESKKVIGNKEK